MNICIAADTCCSSSNVIRISISRHNNSNRKKLIRQPIQQYHRTHNSTEATAEVGAEATAQQKPKRQHIQFIAASYFKCEYRKLPKR